MSIDYDAHEALKRRAIPCQYPECHGHFCQGVECDGPPEMACTAGGQPSVPVRRNRKPLPTLPWWKRWEMQWQRVCAGVKRTG